jgi:hypothetical protein
MSVSRLADALASDRLSHALVVLAGNGELITSFITSPVALQSRGASRSSARTTVVIYDESKPNTVQCTLWGAKTKWVHAEDCGAQPPPASAVGFPMPLGRGDVVLLTSLAAREFRGERRLSTTGASSVVVLGRGSVWWRHGRAGSADAADARGSLDDFRARARESGFAHFRGLFETLCAGDAGVDLMNSVMRARKSSSWNISTQAPARSQTPAAGGGFTAVASLGGSLNDAVSASTLVIISERWRAAAGGGGGAGAGAAVGGGEGDGEAELAAACLCVYFPTENLFVDAGAANAKPHVPSAATRLLPEHWRDRLRHVVCGKCDAPATQVGSGGVYKCAPCALSVKTAFERTSQVVTEGASCRWAFKTAWALLQARAVDWDAAFGEEGDSSARRADAARLESKWVRLTAPMLVSVLAGMDASYFAECFERRESSRARGEQGQPSAASAAPSAAAASRLEQPTTPRMVEVIATELLRALVSGRDQLAWTVKLREE